MTWLRWLPVLGSVLLTLAAPAVSAAAPDRFEILKLLREQNHAALNRLLESYQERFEKDPATELDLEIAFRAFWIADPSLAPLIDEWLRRSPASFSARLARARHFQKLGIERRGARSARDTTADQFRGMEQAFAEAEREAREALRMNPELIEAYAVLMGITHGDLKRCGQLAEEALRVWEGSFRIRALYLDCLRPRWGGSHQAMERFAAASQPSSGRNAKLGALKGYAAWDAGTLLRLDRRYEEALGFFTRALAAGEFWRFYVDRGETYYLTRAHEKALADLNRADQLLPQHPETLVHRASTLMALKREDEALRDLQLVQRIDPTNPSLGRFRADHAKRRVGEGFELARAGRLDESLARFDAALAIVPEHAEAHYGRGRSHLKKGDLDRALADFEAAIRLNPRHYDAHVNADWILARRKAWNRILDHWNRFLALEPSHAGAYLERAGAHRHAGNMPAALRDLTRSCELGNGKACEFQRRAH
jgi:tetratricopeptide (TPR) repeat protein